MKLNRQQLRQRKEWEQAGFQLPDYDIDAMIEKTKEKPEWLHLGAGNIFRAFPAALQQKLLNEGKVDTGIIVAEGYDYEIIQKMYHPHDDLGLLVTLKANGTIEKTVIASVAESLAMDSQDERQYGRLKEILRAPSLKMISFTITEKGYSLKRGDGSFLPEVEQDFQKGADKPASYIGKLTALLYERYLAGKLPIALVSMDNCSHNGTKLYEAVTCFAQTWCAGGFVDSGFVSYIKDPAMVSFTWSMIDKITPRPDESVKQMLLDSGFDDVEPVITAKNTYIAPFVNAEEPQYLVIEDAFPNGRPPLEQAGVMFTDRETVDKVEKMKVCTCLNPLHTALAVFGCLLSYDLIYKEMQNPLLKKLVEVIGYEEGLPVVVDPKILDPKAFIDEVINVRITNPFMPDTPQRIATDTSQKLSVRFGETIRAYAESDSMHVSSLKMIPLVQAGWCRYLMGIDDSGNEFTLSPDPLLDTVCPHVNGLHFGDGKEKVHAALQPILSDADIFGIDLYEASLGELVEQYFTEMIAGVGAVRDTLSKYLSA